jgi:hypothetical protein
VTLTASPDLGSTFAGWSGEGGCSGIGTCQITMTADVQPVATFDLEGGGEQCTGSVAMACNTPVHGSMAGATAKLSRYSCARFGQFGPERIYSLRAPMTGEVTVDLTQISSDYDLFVLSDSSGCNASSCIGGSENGGSSNERISFWASAGQTYYVVVEDYSDAGGNFTVEARCDEGSNTVFLETFESGGTSTFEGESE